MNCKILIFLCFALFAGLNSQAQIKIGYTNVELVLAYMPESKSVEQTLGTFQQKLQQQLEAKQKYARTKLEEYVEKRDKNLASPEQLGLMEKELEKLDTEITSFASESEQKIMAKREELLVPILEKLQNSIEAVAKENGFAYILNQTTSSGVSTILFGPEENDITEILFKKLGIAMPSQNPNPNPTPPNPGGGK